MIWEIEDLIDHELIETFVEENLSAVRHTSTVAGRVHRDLSRDGKARLHRFVKDVAVHSDLLGVIDLLKAVRYYFGLS